MVLPLLLNATSTYSDTKPAPNFDLTRTFLVTSECTHIKRKPLTPTHTVLLLRGTVSSVQRNSDVTPEFPIWHRKWPVSVWLGNICNHGNKPSQVTWPPAHHDGKFLFSMGLWVFDVINIGNLFVVGMCRSAQMFPKAINRSELHITVIYHSKVAFVQLWSLETMHYTTSSGLLLL